MYVLGCLSLTAGIILVYFGQITQSGWTSFAYGMWGVGLILLCIPLFCGASKIVAKSRRKPINNEGIGIKIEAATNVTYMLRIEKEVGDSGAERINYICGYCEVINNLKTIDEERGIFKCLNCGAENHLLK